MATLQPSASRPGIIDFTCSDDDLFNSFDKLTGGSPLQSNVIDLNPFGFEPQNLPEDVWFLIRSNENIDIKHGWKTKEEACEVFSNSEIIGWRATLEYYEGQVPHEYKTDWVMQVFSITQKRLRDDNDKKETSSLCRVFLVSSHEIQQKASSAGIENETRNNLTRPPVLDANSSTRIGSSSNPGPEVNMHHETEVLPVTQRFPVPVPVPDHQGVNLLEMDLSSLSGGNFLELLDLDKQSSSSSSENSSAMSISSDECFDSMAFLHELEDPILEHNDASRRLNVSATNKSDEVVIVPAALGSLVSVEGSNSGADEFFRTTGSVPGSALGSRNLSNKVTKHAEGNQRGKGPSSSSSSSHKPSASSDSHASAAAAAGGRKSSAFGGMKKLRRKFLCFMPF